MVDYTAGVKQGNNLAPILFIIVMHFVSELPENKFKENNISLPSFFITRTYTIKVVN